MTRNVVTTQDCKDARQRKAQLMTLAPADSANESTKLVDPVDISDVDLAKDNYQDRVVKYIPVEAITVYVFIINTINQYGGNQTLLWAAYALCQVGTPIYMKTVTKTTKWSQLVITFVSFFLWASTVSGGPFKQVEGFTKFHTTVLLPIYTFVIPRYNAEYNEGILEKVGLDEGALKRLGLA